MKATIRSTPKLIATLLSAALLQSQPLQASEAPHSMISVSSGIALERKKSGDEDAYAIGMEYEYRSSELWGVGGAVEWLGDDVVRNASIAALLSFHPVGGLRLFGGPGIEFTDTKDKAMLRVGAGYEFQVSEHWFIAPEVFGEFIESGDRIYSGCIAVGYIF